jgi:lipid-A-disaccharide synthase
MAADSKRIYLIAGEASGDLHGANLVRALLMLESNLNIRSWGGDKMRDAGAEVVKHIKDLAFMGFLEVVLNLRKILKNISFCKADILQFKPDALVLIDYPGFNLRIAEWAHNQGISVHYYISPQVWAWKQSRVYKIKRNVKQMYVILPFEKAFYAKFGMNVMYVGHPLLDALGSFEPSESFKRLVTQKSDKPIIALLPGSRKQEISVMLPLMLEAVENLKKYRIVIAGAPSVEKSFYMPIINQRAEVYFGHTYDLVSMSEAALVTSGTATLETALLNIPEVVCYKGSKISYYIAKALIKIRFISLVNLITDREVVTELIQDECNPFRMRMEVEKVLVGGASRQRMLEEYNELRLMLGGGGASMKVAHALLKTIRDCREQL